MKGAPACVIGSPPTTPRARPTHLPSASPLVFPPLWRSVPLHRTFQPRSFPLRNDLRQEVFVLHEYFALRSWQAGPLWVAIRLRRAEIRLRYENRARRRVFRRSLRREATARHGRAVADRGAGRGSRRGNWREGRGVGPPAAAPREPVLATPPRAQAGRRRETPRRPPKSP